MSSGGVYGQRPKTAADMPAESAYGANVQLESAMRSAMFDAAPLTAPWVYVTSQAFDMNKIGGVDPINPRQAMEWTLYGRVELPQAMVNVETLAGAQTVPVGILWDVTASITITAGAGPIGVDRTMRFGARGSCLPILGARPRGAMQIRVRRSGFSTILAVADEYASDPEELMRITLANQWRVRCDITPGAPYEWRGNTTAEPVHLEFDPPDPPDPP